MTTETSRLPNGVIIDATPYGIQDVFWSPDNSFIAGVFQDALPSDFTIFTWNAITGERINYYVSGLASFRGLAWSPNNTQIAVMVEHTTGTNNATIGVVVFSVLKNQNYYGHGHNDYETGMVVNRYESDQQAKAAWNNDGTMLAVALVDQLQIHDLRGDGEALVTLSAYEVTDLEWSSDDLFIAGGSSDGTIRIWGIPTDE